MGGKVLTVGLVSFLILAGAVMLLGPVLFPRPARELPPSPYVRERGFAQMPTSLVRSVGAYEAIRETLLRDSTDGIAEQTEVIARAFAESHPGIVSVAKRLNSEQDVESARRAFMRLHRLMQRHADKLPPAAPPQ
jgi:hypothetical protein